MASKDPNANKDPNKGYVAIFGWSLNAIDAIDRFVRAGIHSQPVHLRIHTKTRSAAC